MVVGGSGPVGRRHASGSLLRAEPSSHPTVAGTTTTTFTSHRLVASGSIDESSSATSRTSVRHLREQAVDTRERKGAAPRMRWPASLRSRRANPPTRGAKGGPREGAGTVGAMMT